MIGLLLFCLHPLFYPFNFVTDVRTKIARNELFRLLMGIFFLVIFSVCEVYRDGRYLQLVEECERHSMVKASEEVKALPNNAQDGEVELCMYITMASTNSFSSVGDN